MKLLFIYPSMGIKETYRIKDKTTSWCLEPLPIATLSGITPKNWIQNFYDDRVEDINFDEDCDIVAITVETFTAKRAYEIASEFRKRKKIVILGGFHVSILPDEALEYCDSVVIGEAEGIWSKVLDDFKNKQLKKKYSLNQRADLSKVNVNREIYGNKKYFPLTLLETGRGCKFKCDFCSVRLFFKGEYRRRPIKDIISEIKLTKSKRFMFIDDNICADIPSAKKLFKALKPLKIEWGGSASINIVKDDELLDLMKESGCIHILLGIESTNKENLKLMKKYQNYDNTDLLIRKLYKRNIKIYGSFVIGYEFDNKQSAEEQVKYAIKNKFFLSNFYPLQPFPGTDLYKRLEKEGRLVYDKWWLDPDYKCGEIVYDPHNMSKEELTKICKDARYKFYSYKSIFKRLTNLKVNSNSFSSLSLFLIANILTRKETHKKQDRKLGRS